MKNLLTTRNKSKAKKPRFERGQSGIMPQFKGTWRRPRGIHNKMRLGLRGKRVGPAVGYSSPKEVKGLERNGMQSVLITTMEELNNIQKEQIIIISAKLGQRKKVEIVKKAVEKKLPILNIKDPQKYLQDIEQHYKKKKEDKKKVEAKPAETKLTAKKEEKPADKPKEQKK